MKLNFKNQLKLYLKEHDLTATKLAKAIGVSPSTVSEWLISSSAPKDITKLKALCDYFNTSMEHLIFGDGIDLKEIPEDMVQDFSSLLRSDGKWFGSKIEIRVRRIK